MRNIATFFLAVTLAAAAPGASEGARVVTASVEPSAARVGDAVRLTVRVAHAPDETLVAPAAPRAAGPWDIRKAEVVAVSESESELRAELAPFEVSDSLALPSLEILLRTPRGLERLPFTPPAVKVESVLPPDEEEPALAPLKKPLPVPYEFPWRLAGAILAALVLLAAAWLLWKRFRRREGKAEPAAPPVPPYEEAVRDLEALRAARLLESGRTAEFYEGLSFILRRYVERRFAVPALERTTDETLALARRHAELHPHADALRRALVESDFVKFAKAEPPVEAGFRLFDDVRAFVERTKPAPPAAEANTGKEKAAA